MTTTAITTAATMMGRAGHADGGDDRVEREDDVEQHDLHDDGAEAGGRLGRRRVAPRAPSSLSWIS
jgi:hypothetical protein